MSKKMSKKNCCTIIKVDNGQLVEPLVNTLGLALKLLSYSTLNYSKVNTLGLN